MEQFLQHVFGYASVNQIIEWIIRILLSSFFGICLGWERRNRRQIIGIRTLLLISVSATLLGILSEYVTLSIPNKFAGDPGRIAAAVVTGIGFVGGGAIMHRGLNVKGVTTAALIWSAAALGLALGDGLYVPAIIVFIIIIFLLPIFRRFESNHFATAKMKIIRVKYAQHNCDYQEMTKMLQENNVNVNDLSFSKDKQTEISEFTFFVYMPREMDYMNFDSKFNQFGKLISFSISDT